MYRILKYISLLVILVCCSCNSHISQQDQINVYSLGIGEQCEFVHANGRIFRLVLKDVVWTRWKEFVNCGWEVLTEHGVQLNKGELSAVNHYLWLGRARVLLDWRGGAQLSITDGLSIPWAYHNSTSIWLYVNSDWGQTKGVGVIH